MSSKTEISNMAISHLGIGKEIANLDTEKSEEANACRRFFKIAAESTLGDIDWTFATKFLTLNLIEECPFAEEWKYAYRYPTDCLNLRRILSGIRNDTSKTRVVFKLSRDGNGQIILTDQEVAVAEYTENLGSTAFYTPEFTLALSFRLAALIAPRITGGDPFQAKEDMLRLYDLEIKNAKKKNINEETSDNRPESEFITVRK